MNDFKEQPLMPAMISYNTPRAAKADINKDGLEDIFICGGLGSTRKNVHSANGWQLH
jgi:hypothetical protein